MSSVARIETEERVPCAEFVTCQVFPFVLERLAGGGKQVQVISDVSSIGESRLQGLIQHVTTVHGWEVYIVVVGVKRVFVVGSIEGVFIDKTQHHTLR